MNRTGLRKKPGNSEDTDAAGADLKSVPARRKTILGTDCKSAPA
jgi:hypothetical protein